MKTILQIRNADCDRTDFVNDTDKYSWSICEDFDVSKEYERFDSEEKADKALATEYSDE